MKSHKLSKSGSKETNKNQLLLFAGALIVYFFYVKTTDNILNYPKVIALCLGIIVFICVFGYRIRRLLHKVYLCSSLKDKSLFILVEMLTSAMFAWFLAGIVLIPFNYYNIYSSQDNPLEIIYAPIKSIYTRPRNNVIYYELNGKTKLLYGKIKIMDEIDKQIIYQEYELKLRVRRGLLSSYILEDWNIEKK